MGMSLLRWSPKEWSKRLARLAGFEITRTPFGLEITRSARRGVNPYRDMQRILDPLRVKTIFDVGANRGQSAMSFLDYFPSASIESFEPDPRTYAELQIATRQHQRITTHCLALGAADSSAKLNLSKASEGNSLLRSASDMPPNVGGAWTQHVGDVQVQVQRLDTFCLEHAIGQIDVLKSDTQGFELQVLHGAGDMLKRSTVRAVYVEVVFVPLYEGQGEFIDIYMSLTSRGYHLVDFYNQSHAPDGGLVWCDALFC